MNKNNLKNFLNIDEDVQNKDLSLDACNEKEFEANKKIKNLFDIALEERFLLYFDGRYVMEPYDGLEFKTLEEEFYYNNGNSYLVFSDSNDFKVTFKIKYLREYNFNMVYKVVEKAVIYTKANPDVSDYKLY